MSTAPFAVTCDTLQREQEARLLAQHLKAPFYLVNSPELTSMALALTDSHLELRDFRQSPPSVLYIDFVNGAFGYRRQHGGGRRQPIAKAAGIRPGVNPTVLDATAGLGRDAFVLACLGCTVLMVERSPIVAALLRDGLWRASQASETADIVQGRLQLIEADALVYLSKDHGDFQPDVVYLDPMYPERKKSALVKKEMQFLHTIVGVDTDTTELLAMALMQARQRVVVKRPRTAPRLIGPTPQLCIESKNTRYDVYLRTPVKTD